LLGVGDAGEAERDREYKEVPHGNTCEGAPEGMR
jgi:hypothetical protein